MFCKSLNLIGNLIQSVLNNLNEFTEREFSYNKMNSDILRKITSIKINHLIVIISAHLVFAGLPRPGVSIFKRL